MLRCRSGRERPKRDWCHVSANTSKPIPMKLSIAPAPMTRPVLWQVDLHQSGIVDADYTGTALELRGL